MNTENDKQLFIFQANSGNFLRFFKYKLFSGDFLKQRIYDRIFLFQNICSKMTQIRHPKNHRADPASSRARKWMEERARRRNHLSGPWNKTPIIVSSAAPYVPLSSSASLFVLAIQSAVLVLWCQAAPILFALCVSVSLCVSLCVIDQYLPSLARRFAEIPEAVEMAMVRAVLGFKELQQCCSSSSSNSAAGLLIHFSKAHHTSISRHLSQVMCYCFSPCHSLRSFSRD